MTILHFRNHLIIIKNTSTFKEFPWEWEVIDDENDFIDSGIAKTRKLALNDAILLVDYWESM